jgi:hypothetical protein
VFSLELRRVAVRAALKFCLRVLELIGVVAFSARSGGASATAVVDAKITNVIGCLLAGADGCTHRIRHLSTNGSKMEAMLGHSVPIAFKALPGHFVALHGSASRRHAA